MELRTKKELHFYIIADRIMNRGVLEYTLKQRIKNIFCPDYIMDYLECMRYLSYYKNKNNILWYWYQYKYRKLGLKLGFSIGYNVFGYGLLIPHYGTIVVGGSNRIGNYAVLHTSTCISDNGKVIGDALYMGTGSKITSKIQLGNNISIGANSLVNRSFLEDNIMIGGMPAKCIKKSETWYIRGGKTFTDKVNKIEHLKEMI